MITIADLKQHLEQFDDDAMIVFRADTERELYDDSALIDMRERLTFEPVSQSLMTLTTGNPITVTPIASA